MESTATAPKIQELSRSYKLNLLRTVISGEDQNLRAYLRADSGVGREVFRLVGELYTAKAEEHLRSYNPNEHQESAAADYKNAAQSYGAASDQLEARGAWKKAADIYGNESRKAQQRGADASRIAYLSADAAEAYDKYGDIPRANAHRDTLVELKEQLLMSRVDAEKDTGSEYSRQLRSNALYMMDLAKQARSEQLLQFTLERSIEILNARSAPFENAKKIISEAGASAFKEMRPVEVSTDSN